jgi:hypothetical protein
MGGRVKYQIEVPGHAIAIGDYLDEAEARNVVFRSGLVGAEDMRTVKVTPLRAEPEKPRVLDTATVLADLAAWWSQASLPLSFSGRVPSRIAGGKFDQRVPGGTQNPYWEIARQLPLDDMPLPWHQRPEPMLHWLGGRGVVEPGAGTGYWAWQMEQAGISVAAYEPEVQGPANHFARRTWTTLLRDDHAAPRHHGDRALFLCWPSYAEPWAAQSLACYTGDLLVYCGEGEGGCTADDGFFELLAAEWEEVSDSAAHVSYWGIHDYLTAYRRK